MEIRLRAKSPSPLGKSCFAIAFALLLASGCSTSPRLVRWESAGAADEGIRIAIAPMNLAVALAPELEHSVTSVESELIEYFQGRDARVAVVHRADAWELWRNVIATIQQSDAVTLDFDTAARLFVSAVSEHGDFDLFVMPSLVFREARATGRYARWDGVRRRIRFYDRSASRGMELDDSEWKSRLSALSLHALVYTPDGKQIYQGWGGLDVIHDPVVGHGQVADRPTLRLRRDLLSNPEFVREGISLALNACALEVPH